MNKKLFLSMLAIFLLFGGTAAYAGKIIKTYKTVRGTTATVEQEEVHKGRIGLTVNGAAVNKPTWYAGATTYVPLRAVSEMLGASVNYNSDTQSADIILKSGDSPQKNLDVLKVYSDLSYSLMSTEGITDLFFMYQTLIREAPGEIDYYGTRETLDFLIQEYDTLIDIYNAQVDMSNASLANAERKGVLTEPDNNLFIDTMDELSLALKELGLSILVIDKYYYQELSSYEQAFTHLSNSFSHQRTADDIILDGLSNYHSLTQNYNSSRVSASENKNVKAPIFEKREKYKPYKK